MSDKHDFAIYFAADDPMRHAHSIFGAGGYAVTVVHNRAGVERIVVEGVPGLLLDLQDIKGSPLNLHYQEQDVQLETLLRFRMPYHEGLEVLFRWMNDDLKTDCMVFVDDEAMLLQRRGVLLLHSGFDKMLHYLKMLDRPFILKDRID